MMVCTRSANARQPLRSHLLKNETSKIVLSSPPPDAGFLHIGSEVRAGGDRWGRVEVAIGKKRWRTWNREKSREVTMDRERSGEGGVLEVRSFRSTKEITDTQVEGTSIWIMICNRIALLQFGISTMPFWWPWVVSSFSCSLSLLLMLRNFFPGMFMLLIGNLIIYIDLSFRVLRSTKRSCRSLLIFGCYPWIELVFLSKIVRDSILLLNSRLIYGLLFGSAGFQ